MLQAKKTSAAIEPVTSGNCGSVNVKGTMLILPLALRTQMMHQRINSAVSVNLSYFS